MKFCRMILIASLVAFQVTPPPKALIADGHEVGAHDRIKRDDELMSNTSVISHEFRGRKRTLKSRKKALRKVLKKVLKEKSSFLGAQKSTKKSALNKKCSKKLSKKCSKAVICSKKGSKNCVAQKRNPKK